MSEFKRPATINFKLLTIAATIDPLTTLTTLPKVVSKVFDFLNQRDLDHCRLVCKLWNSEVIRMQRKCVTRVPDHTEKVLESFLEMLEKSQNPEYVFKRVVGKIWSPTDPPTATDLKIQQTYANLFLTFGKHVTELTLYGVRHMQFHYYLVHWCPNVTDLHINMINFNRDVPPAEFANRKLVFPLPLHIRRLTIEDRGHAPVIAKIWIITVLRSSPQLKSLTLPIYLPAIVSGMQIYEQYKEFLPALESLEELHTNPIGKDNLPKIFGTFKNVNKLYLDVGSWFGSQTGQYRDYNITDLVMNFPDLVHLEVKLGKWSTYHLDIENLSRNPFLKLRVLNLYYSYANMFSYELADLFVKSFPAVEILNVEFEHRNMDLDQFGIIFSAFAKFAKLRKLGIKIVTGDKSEILDALRFIPNFPCLKKFRLIPMGDWRILEEDDTNRMLNLTELREPLLASQSLQLLEINAPLQNERNIIAFSISNGINLKMIPDYYLFTQ